jgi:hypothetical protein
MKTLKFQTDMDCSLELQEKIEENNDTEIESFSTYPVVKQTS